MTEQILFPFISGDEPKPIRLRARGVELVMEDALEIAEPPRTRGPILNRPVIFRPFPSGRKTRPRARARGRVIARRTKTQIR